MKEIEKQIEKIYKSVRELIKTNLNWYDNIENKVIRCSTYFIPDVIREVEEEKLISVGELLEKGNSKSVCYFENAYKLRYLAIPKFREDIYEGAAILGPYLNYEHTTRVIQTILEDKELKIEECEKLHLFYELLAIADFNKEAALAQVIKAFLYCEPLENEPFEIENKEEIQEVNLHYLVEDIELKGEGIQRGYEIEEELVHYINTGNTQKAMQMIGGKEIPSLNRFPNEPLRELKNMLIVTNTICRRILCENKVQPYLIHLISEKYSIAIERSNNKNNLQKLAEDMVGEYCEAINKYKRTGYSDVINRAIKYIDLHFNQVIRLNQLAKSLYVHPNYLSQKFKDETQITISEYINQVRIKESKYLLKYKIELSITDIAYLVGYNDKNYFSKVFKHSEGITPKNFRENK